VHTADSRDDAVCLSQTFYESRDGHDLAAVAFEEARRLVQSLGR
jgi:hypothetical protein